MREEIILNLEIEDYSKGPLEEAQQGGTEMWIFGEIIKGQQIYIKLTISQITDQAICISFHKAEFFMEFPFKD
ncbi:hypothetical protein [Galbibacter orientalis]|uniref:hypothetical protein n=1 Tax=Galbibacter orientalis TaxID=453852 RepID=UPI003080E9E9